MSLESILVEGRNCRQPVAAFNVFDAATVRGAIAAAAERARPIILQFSQRTVQHLGARFCSAVVVESCRNLGADGVFIHLDHVTDPPTITDALQGGFDGVMYDGSHLPYELNVATTRRWVATGRPLGVIVEGEITPIAGAEDGVFSEAGEPLSIAMASQFVEATGVALFSGAIGTAHGEYKSHPKLDFELIGQLSRIPDAGFVVHGGSGLDSETLVRLARSGVAKVNFSSDLKKAWLGGGGSSSEVDPYGRLRMSEEAVRQVCADKMRSLDGNGGAH